MSDNSITDDNVKFKVQEMHFLNELYKYYNSIEYMTEGANKTTWFQFSKAIKNNILIELNINSLIDTFDLNNQTFKDDIGSLNWKKFAERIKTQLKENEFLTQNQRNSMQFNAIISLIKSNNFEEAKTMLKESLSKPQFQNATYEGLLASVQAYFYVKEKKFQEALDCLEADSEDVRTILLKSHLLLALKKQKLAILNLIDFSQKMIGKPE